MRQIGHKPSSQLSLLPEGSNFHLARAHQQCGQALAAVSTTGILKGIYRFSSHEEMNRHSENALSIAIVANLRRREHSGG
jgi:hypothetical protein